MSYWITTDFFEPIVPLLGQGEAFAKIISGDIQLPYEEDVIYSPFAPALIPLWPTGARNIFGLWKHWFVDSRQPTFVDYNGVTIAGERNIVFETARTFEQLMYLYLLWDFNEEDGPTEETLELAKQVGITDIDEINRISMDSGNDEDFLQHPAFAHNLPLSCFGESVPYSRYKGDFPNEAMELSAEILRHTCVFELHNGVDGFETDYTLREKVASSSVGPEWFKTDQQRPVFESLLNKGDFTGAWMSLNSPGWTLGEAKQAILALAKRANHRDFAVYAQRWSELPFDDDLTI